MRSRFLMAAVLFAGALGCDDDGGRADRVDPAQLANSSGEVALSDGGTLSFTLTSERYKQWDAAQRALDKRVARRFGELLQPASPSERSIGAAVAYLEQDARSRQAIEKAGLSVRGFVELTLALEQQMRLASGQPSSSRARTRTAPVDSGFIPPPVSSAPAPVDASVRADTLFPAPLPAPAPVPRPTPAPRDSIRPVRDTVVPTRDTVPVRRDTAPSPAPPPDTQRVLPDSALTA